MKKKALDHLHKAVYWISAWNGRPEGPTALQSIQKKLGGTITRFGLQDVLVVELTHESARVEFDDLGRDLQRRVLTAIRANDNDGNVAISHGKIA